MMMRSILAGVSAAALTTLSGFAETIITADHVIDSDVVLESAVEEVKSAPEDAAAVVGDVIEFGEDELWNIPSNAVEALISEFTEKGAHEQAQEKGLSAIAEAWDSSRKIQFRSYRVSKRLGDLLQAYVQDKSAPTVDVTGFFSSVDFPEKASANYLPEFQSLFVHQTGENLLAIESVLASYQREQKNLLGRQVEIEAKFVEINESSLNQLGFDWSFDGKNGGDLKLFDNLYLPAGQDVLSAGLRGTAQALGGAPAAGVMDIVGNSGSVDWSLAISALERMDDSDVLSAPRVVTHSHETAVIQVGEERMLPKSFEVVNQNTSPFVEHSDWELELMGVHLEVTPEIRRDGLIDLELNSKILDIIGYDSYPITPAYTRTLGDSVNKAGDEIDMLAISASLPYLRVRALDTRVTVSDGGTIGMGGLIYDKNETYRDKVPVLGSIPLLGRLFRSEGERSVKRNLIIFVSATQVDVNGRRSADRVLQR